MLHATLRTIEAYAYPFCQPHDTRMHMSELLERYTSLLLGYNKAYLEAERPQEKDFLNLDYIIPFLYRHRSTITDPSKYKETRVLGFEFDFIKSPLVQIIFKLSTTRPKVQTSRPKFPLGTKSVPHTEVPPSRDTDAEETPDASTTIQQLYTLWEDAKQDTKSSAELNYFLVKLITGYRYEHVQVREALKNNVEKAEIEVGFWVTVEKQVEAFMSFLRKYEVALVDSTPLPDTLCPVDATVDVTAFEEDVQLPMEVL